jgi:hypothetical protein
MVMTRLVVGLSLVLAIGCNKPSEENCRKAIANMQSLLDTEHLLSDASLQGEIRRCKGGSTKEAVDCAIKATSLDELRACGFAKIPERITPATDDQAGSAAPKADGSGAAPAAEGSGAQGSGAEGADGAGAEGADGSGADGSGAEGAEGSGAEGSGAEGAEGSGADGSAGAPAN